MAPGVQPIESPNYYEALKEAPDTNTATPEQNPSEEKEALRPSKTATPSPPRPRKRRPSKGDTAAKDQSEPWKLKLRWKPSKYMTGPTRPVILFQAE